MQDSHGRYSIIDVAAAVEGLGFRSCRDELLLRTFIVNVAWISISLDICTCMENFPDCAANYVDEQQYLSHDHDT